MSLFRTLFSPFVHAENASCPLSAFPTFRIQFVFPDVPNCCRAIGAKYWEISGSYWKITAKYWKARK